MKNMESLEWVLIFEAKTDIIHLSTLALSFWNFHELL